MASVRSSVLDFFAEYHDLRCVTAAADLEDVLGFLSTGTRPKDERHVYHRFTAIEDKYMDTISQLRPTWRADVPCLENFLMIDLDLKRPLRARFIKEFATDQE